MNTHAWRERTDDGEMRFVRANRHGRRWTVQSRLKSQETWTMHDPATAQDLRQLRDLLLRKYQRRRATLDEVREIEAMIDKAP